MDNRLRARRLLAGLTQAQLAERAGVSLRAVRNAELGHVRSSRAETTRRLLAVLADEVPDLSIRVLGPLSVHQSGEPVDLGAEKQRRLLALLAIQPNRVVRREEIVDVLWGNEPPSSCLELVHTYVARLRKVLEPRRVRQEPARVITTVTGGYLLSVEEKQLDLLQFEAAAKRAEEAEDLETAERYWLEALGVWRGPALAGMDGFRHHPVRHALLARRSAAVLAYAEVAGARGNHGDAVPHLRALTAAEPLHETAHAQLMLSLAGAGQQAAALELFDEIRRRLAGDLGIEPGPELRRAHARVLRPEVPDGDRPRPAQLPADVGAFTGRARELASLNHLLPDDGTDVRIAVVSGTAGVGKTAVAVRWAHRSRERFPDGQLYLDLRGYGPERPVEPGDALSGFLRALGVAGTEIPAEEDQRAARFRTELDDRRLLLILDNAGSVEQIRPLLPGAASCSVLVTSRETLPALIARHGAHRVQLDLLTPEDALDLLRTLLGERVTAEPVPAEALAEYCVRLPLALRLVAELALARPEVSLAELATELADERRRLDLLDGGGDPRTAVRAVFSWSYGHLPGDAARMFRLWGLHPGRALTADAAAALAGTGLVEAQRLIDVLVRAHLAEELRPGRYQLHDLLRVYAAELAEDDRDALTRLFDHYVAAAALAMDLDSPQEKHLRPEPPPLRFPDWRPPNAQQWLETERGNLLAVASHATRNGWPEHVRLLSGILWKYLDLGGYHEDALMLHTHASAFAEAGERTDPLTLIGLGYWRVGRSKEALSYLEEALAAARESGNRNTESYVLNTLGLVCRALGRFADALAYLEQALELARETGDRTSEGLVLVVLGAACRGMGRYRDAARYLELALAAARETGDRTSEGYVWVNLGDVLSAQGKHEKAVSSLEQGLTLFAETGTRTSEGYALGILGGALRCLGRYEDALERLDQALAVSRETGGRVNEGVALKHRGDVHQELGSHDEAARCLGEALAIARECADRGVESRVLNSLGALALARGESAEAARFFRGALEIAVETGCTGDQACAHRGLGDATGEREHWERALALFAEMGVPEADEVRTRLDLARV
ncbi:tetratricopeptide repeat protein [Amycolatopsis sp. YIM 10]|uniref:tetratricopeptide repeat protein n=1 Tax=Amycolatopsis sp. YIM 10 TaxID=2653857 RepID=UPI0012A9D38A|nr:tetratricopeptide repeat protein [Amycolatopsis sp. YIM 10]QFU86954.1 Regulatory protein AfsR [Amycolatopsis sp. YIM 10]